MIDDQFKVTTFFVSKIQHILIFPQDLQRVIMIPFLCCSLRCNVFPATCSNYPEGTIVTTKVIVWVKTYSMSDFPS